MWVEGITRPAVGMGDGMLAFGEIVEVSDEIGRLLVDNGQAVEVPAPGAAPVALEGEDADESEQE